MQVVQADPFSVKGRVHYHFSLGRPVVSMQPLSGIVEWKKAAIDNKWLGVAVCQ